MSDNSSVFKEGWIHKRGEHIKTWRPRYFILKTDGHFLGFNGKPTKKEAPNNTFFVKDCKILVSDKPKPNVFVIRCLNSENTIIERFFACSSSQERDEWVKAVESLSSLLNGHVVVQNSDKEIPKITFHDFEFLKVLGKGTFGKVILCREKLGKRLCAMKILKKSLVFEKNEIVHTQTENKVMRTIKHPFITNLIYSFQTNDCLCLVMEYVNGGELFFHLSREKKFSEWKAKFYAAEICCAIGFLHKHNIIYRDIKLENILLDSQGHIKLTDFGLCKMNIGFNSTTETFCGTLEYLAPEIVSRDLNGSRGYTRAVDWWAVGVVLYEMIVGRLPFSVKSSNDNQNLFEKICKDDIYLPDDLSVESKLIINQLLEKQPFKRLGSSSNDFEDIKVHLFFSDIDWNKLVDKKIEPPFRPIIDSDADTSYFAKEFTGELVQLTPPTRDNYFLNIHSSLNYFDSFSYYGSKTSLNSQKSNSSMRLPGQMHTNNLIHVDQFDIEMILNQSPTHSINEKYSHRAYGSILEEEESKSLFKDLTSTAFPGLIQFQHVSNEDFSLKQFYSTQKRDGDLNERFSFTSSASSTDCSVKSSASNTFSINCVNKMSQSSYENEIVDMEMN